MGILRVITNPVEEFEIGTLGATKKSFFFSLYLVSTLNIIFFCLSKEFGVLIILPVTIVGSTLTTLWWYFFGPFCIKWCSRLLRVKRNLDDSGYRKLFFITHVPPYFVTGLFGTLLGVFGLNKVDGFMNLVALIWVLIVVCKLFKVAFNVGKIRSIMIYTFPVVSTFLIAQLIITYAFAIYVIPTGGMQPTLKGASDYGVGDKVVVNKLAYLMSKPKRWELGVYNTPFKSLYCDKCSSAIVQEFFEENVPESRFCNRCNSEQLVSVQRKQFVQRVIGMPNENVKIYDGEIYIDKGGVIEILKKPLNVFHEGAINIFDWKGSPIKAIQSSKFSKSEVEMSKGKDIKVTDGAWFFGDKISGVGDTRKHYLNSEFPINEDFMVKLTLANWPLSGNTIVGVKKDYDLFRLVFDPIEKSSKIYLNKKELCEINNKTSLIIKLFFLDGDVGIEWGDEVKRIAMSKGLQKKINKLSVYLEVKGTIQLSNLEIMKDVFYTESYAKFKNIELGSTEYFLLGDNSFFSYDCRVFGPIQEQHFVGRVEAIILPYKRARWF